MIVEVFVAQAFPVHSLGHQFTDGVLDELGIAIIGEAIGEAANDAGSLLDFPEQLPAAVGGDRPAVKVGHNFAASVVVKRGGFRVTLCNHGASSSARHKWFW